MKKNNITSKQPALSKRWICLHWGDSILPAQSLRKLFILVDKSSSQAKLGRNRLFFELRPEADRSELVNLQKRITGLAQELHLDSETIDWGQGETMEDAWVEVKWGALSMDYLPPESLLSYLDPVGTERTQSSQRILQQRIRRLNLESLKELVMLPEATLVESLGSELNRLINEQFPHVQKEQQTDTHFSGLTTSDQLFESRHFQLEDWIPTSYLEVG